MSDRILYIGVGSSGLKMLDEAQRFFYSTSGSRCPEHVRFLFIETDQGEAPADIPGKPEGYRPIEAFYAPLKDAASSVQELRRKAKVRIVESTEPPPDGIVLAKFFQGQLVVENLQGKTLPQALYAKFAHVVSGSEGRLSHRAAAMLEPWLKEAGWTSGFLSLLFRKDLPDRVELHLPLPLPPKIRHRIEILFNNVELIIEPGDGDEKLKWMPELTLLNQAERGAGGMRSYGRVALWSSGNSGRHFQELHKTISELYQGLSAGGGARPTIYISGTFAGGTNSGMFLDVAYLCRRIANPPDGRDTVIHGLFLLPPPYAVEPKPRANAHACLRDLIHFSGPDAQFLAAWPDDVAHPFPAGFSPFSTVTLMSAGWVGDGSPPLRLYRMGGLFLFLMGTGFLGYRDAKTVDLDHMKFSAVGLTCLFYPKGEIRSSAAIDYTLEELLPSWGLQEGVEQSKERAANQADRFLGERLAELETCLDNALESALHELTKNGPERQATSTWLQDFLQEVDRGERAFDRKELLELLGTESRLYQASRAWAGKAAELFRQRIGAFVVDQIERHGSLLYGEKLLQAIGTRIAAITHFWKSCGVTDWKVALERAPGGLISDILESQESLILERHSVRRSRLEEAVLRMHLGVLEPKLTDFIEYLESGKIARSPAEARQISEKEIPHQAGIRSVRLWLGRARENLRGLRDRIALGVRPSEFIEYHYQTGEFEGDVRKAVQTFKELWQDDPAAGSRSAELLRYDPSKGLWPWLLDHYGRPEILAAQLVQELSDRFRALDIPSPSDGTDLFSDESIREKLAKLAKAARESVSIQLGGASTPLRTRATHPRVFVCGPKSLSKVKECLAAKGEDQFSGIERACSAYLDDMTVFFDERPITNIEEIDNYSTGWQTAYDQRRHLDNSLDSYVRT